MDPETCQIFPFTFCDPVMESVILYWEWKSTVMELIIIKKYLATALSVTKRWLWDASSRFSPASVPSPHFITLLTEEELPRLSCHTMLFLFFCVCVCWSGCVYENVWRVSLAERLMNHVNGLHSSRLFMTLGAEKVLDHHSAMSSTPTSCCTVACVDHICVYQSLSILQT